MRRHQLARIRLSRQERKFSAADGGRRNGGQSLSAAPVVRPTRATEAFKIVAHKGHVFPRADSAHDDVREGAGEIEVLARHFSVDEPLRPLDNIGGVLTDRELESKQHVCEMSVGGADGTGIGSLN